MLVPKVSVIGLSVLPGVFMRGMEFLGSFLNLICSGLTLFLLLLFANVFAVRRFAFSLLVSALFPQHVPTLSCKINHPIICLHSNEV